MSEPMEFLSAKAVAPLNGVAPVRRDWRERGLPERGWVLITDQVECARCTATEGIKPCARACGVTHGLALDVRADLGVCAWCDPAPCEEVCPAGAVHHTEQGAVEVDQEVCVGCRFCADVCPNDAILYVDPYRTETPPNGLPGYNPGQPTGALPNTVAKCTLCSTRLTAGMNPVCMEACPQNGIWVGNLDRNTVTNGIKVGRLTELLDTRPHEIVQPGRRAINLVG